jgi:hypothetical protein
MHNLFDRVRDRIQKDIERERGLDHPVGKISLLLWPYPESKLIFYISLLAALDFISTFIALNLNYSGQVFEVGLLAKWALQNGGFSGLLLTDIVCIGTLICLAIGVKYLYRKLGFNGFGRAAFVLLLIPYFLFIIGVVVNNVLVTFM